MSEKLTAQSRLDGFDEAKRAQEEKRYAEAAYGEAGETDFSDSAKQRLADQRDYEQYMEKFTADDRDPLDRHVAAVDNGERKSNEDARVRRMETMARQISELRTAGPREGQSTEEHESIIADKEAKLEELVNAYANGETYGKKEPVKDTPQSNKAEQKPTTPDVDQKNGESTNEKTDKSTNARKDKKPADNAKAASSNGATPKTDVANASENGKTAQTDKPKQPSVFTAEFAKLSRDEQARVIDAAYGAGSSTKLTPEQVTNEYDGIIADSIVKAAAANGYKSENTETAPTDMAEATSDTAEATVADSSSETEDSSAPEIQRAPQTNLAGVESEPIDFADRDTVVHPVAASPNGSTSHIEDGVDTSGLENLRNAARDKLDAEDAASAETDEEEVVEQSRFARARAAISDSFHRVGAVAATSKDRMIDGLRGGETDSGNKKRALYALGAVAGLAIAVGTAWAISRGISSGGSGSASAITPDQLPKPGNPNGSHEPGGMDVVRDLLDNYSVPQGGDGEDVMVAAGRPTADWYNGLGHELATKLPNEFTQLAANDIRINRPGVLSQEAQNIIENWHR